ncbi:protein of unknown function [Magnetospirillum sp. XM-1]|nr:protein of unknown function [Magnetospirillum sp. XM-1]
MNAGVVSNSNIRTKRSHVARQGT